MLLSIDCWTAFLLGLVGSLHCAGMCGPLALALPAAGNTMPGYVLGRVAYNTGRIVTYCLLGIVFGLAGWTFLLAGLLRRRFFAALAVLGLLNGLLPCGLVYVACAGAAATGGTMAGASYMTAFGIGTVPMMLAISLSGKLVPPSLRLKLVKTIPVCVFLLATLLIMRGMSLGIPYVSPDMSGSGASCCHK